MGAESAPEELCFNFRTERWMKSRKITILNVYVSCRSCWKEEEEGRKRHEKDDGHAWGTVAG
jgi:hypothetical protein